MLGNSYDDVFDVQRVAAIAVLYSKALNESDSTKLTDPSEHMGVYMNVAGHEVQAAVMAFMHNPGKLEEFVDELCGSNKESL